MIGAKFCTILLIILFFGGAKRVHQCGVHDVETETREPIFLTVCALVGVSLGTWNAVASGTKLADDVEREYNQERFALELPNLIDDAYAGLPFIANSRSEIPHVVAKKALGAMVLGRNGSLASDPYSFDLYAKTEGTLVSLVSAYLHCQDENILRALQHAMLKLQKIKDHGYVKEEPKDSDDVVWDILNFGFEFIDGFANALMDIDPMNTAALAEWIMMQAAQKFVEHGMKDTSIKGRLRQLRASEAVTWGSTGLGLALGTVATFLDPSGLSITALALGVVSAGEEAIAKVIQDKAWKTRYCPEIASYASHKGNLNHTAKDVLIAAATPLDVVAKALNLDLRVTPQGQRSLNIEKLDADYALYKHLTGAS